MALPAFITRRLGQSRYNRRIGEGLTKAWEDAETREIDISDMVKDPQFQEGYEAWKRRKAEYADFLTRSQFPQYRARAEAAEARVRELEGALEAARREGRASDVRSSLTGIIGNVDLILQDALPASSEKGTG
jgi:multidrug resistance efflux pump